MKLVEGVLYIGYTELVSCGVSENTIRRANYRNSSSWSFIKDPDNRSKLLIEYEKLKPEYQEKVLKRFGNPYDYMAKQPIRNMVKCDHKAEEFFLSYRYDDNKSLPTEHVRKYTNAVNWLNMLLEANEDKRSLKKLLKLSLSQFYDQVIQIIKIDNINLPTSYRRLMAKMKDYDKNGYESMIDWRFGNKMAAKVKDELCESILLELISHPNQYDDVLVCAQYNKWAKENNYKKITPAAVGTHRRKNEHLIIMNREGNSALNEKFLRQVKGFRPSQPLYMVESDDNHIDLFFTDGSNHFRKYKAIVVVDSFNDYVLGYAYAENLSIELVKAAYLNAMYYIRSITGDWHLPHETKSDRWAITTLEPFYQSIGNYFKTPVGSKHRGYIEQFFGSPHWQRCLKLGATNYSGHNITARRRGVNTDVLNLNGKNRPMIGNEAIEQLENFFHRLRHLPQSNGISKHDQWLEAWQNLPTNNKRTISDEQFLLKFGIEHNTTGRPIRITNRGVEPQINGIQYSYDLEVQSLMPYVGKAVRVIYDPYDMSRVLVTDNENVRLIGREARLQSRALHDANPDSRTYLNAILNEKRDDVSYIAGKREHRLKVLEEASIDAESLLQAGVMVKELKQNAEQKMISKLSGDNDDDEDYNYDIFNEM